MIVYTIRSSIRAKGCSIVKAKVVGEKYVNNAILNGDRFIIFNLLG